MHFNQRWTVLEKLYLSRVPADLVGKVIEHWLSYDDHARYDKLENNCQHFVRDFVAPFTPNAEAAKRLSSSFDDKILKSFIPGGMMADRIGSEAQCHYAFDKLWPVLKAYKTEEELRREQTESEVCSNAADIRWNVAYLNMDRD